MGDQVHASAALTLETEQKETWAALRQFCTQNEGMIERSKSVNVGQGQFQEHLDHVLETSKVLLDGLDALADIHPIVGAAVWAFGGIIKLDITIKENNRKVLAVRLQMQSMMSAMFQLCDLKYSHILDEPQRADQRAQLQNLIELIANEIKRCGSDLSYYSGRKFLSKMFKAFNFKRRFAEHVETFKQRQSDLQTILTAFTVASIDAVHEAIGHFSHKVDIADKKLDLLLAVFNRLDTPSEREAIQFIDENGGPEKCISNDELLKPLLTKSGQATIEPGVLADTRKTIRMELSEDLDSILSANLVHFERQVALQNSNLERISYQIEGQDVKLDKLVTSISNLQQAKRIRNAMRLHDDELQTIWDDMGLTSARNVKAKRFVLTLRDYLITPPPERSINATPESYLAPLPEQEIPSFQVSLPVPDHYATGIATDADAWVLNHINAANMQPLIEAMDVDGSGFISVQEANNFARIRPKGMNLFHWFAYWAAGWRYNITDHRSRIYKILQQLHELRENVLPANRKLFATYLDDGDYFRIEGILRHISGPASNVPRDPKLAEVAASIAKLQEERLKENLQKLLYVLRSPDDATLVIGNGYLERWLLPLLSVILRRHLDVFKLATSHRLASREFLVHRISLGSILDLYQKRMQQLRDIFRPTQRNTEAHFKNFAYGMFVEAFKWTGQRIPEGNTVLDFVDEMWVDTDDDDLKDAAATTSLDNGPSDTSILGYGVADGAECQDFPESVANSGSWSDIKDQLAAPLTQDNVDPSQDRVLSNVEGRWVGSFADNIKPPFECILGPIVDKAFEGKGRDYTNLLTFSGRFDERTGAISISFKDTDLALEGTYDPARDTIQGNWTRLMGPLPSRTAEDEDRSKNRQGEGMFTMTRHTTVSSFRFRLLLDPRKNEPEMHIARRRWAFAIQAVLFDVQDKPRQGGFLGISPSSSRRAE